VIITDKKLQTLDSDVVSLICRDGLIRFIQFENSAYPDHEMTLKHFSKVFPPPASDVIANVIYGNGRPGSGHQSTISVNGRRQPRLYDVKVSTIEQPESEHPLFHVTLKSRSASDVDSVMLKDLLDQSSDSIMVFEPVRNRTGQIADFKWKYANLKAGLLTGCETGELTGKNLIETLPDSVIARLFEQYVQVVETGEPIQHEYSYDQGRTEKKWFHSDIRRYDDGVAVSFQDITGRKKEIQKTGKLNQQLKYSNAQKDKLFSIIAHDFRTPFAGCLGMLEMVLEDRDAYERDDLYEMLEMIYKQSRSTYHLLESLLDWALIQQNQLNFSPVRTDLQAIVDLMFRMLNHDAAEKNIGLKNSIPKGTIVYADKYMLRTILRNLISNGIKFTNPDGKIIIDAEKKGEFVEISVTDNGIGIQKGSQKKIFDIDYQYIGKGTNGEKGTGIGLHVCRDFIHKHGGEIRVESKPGTGSTFRFSLPYKKI
jgi:signal transduction histidine kinase